MRRNTEIIGLPCNGVGVGKRSNGCEKEEALMNYSGWYLAAAGPRVSRAVPGPVMVGTSGAHGGLKALDNHSSHGSLGHHLKWKERV